MSTSEYPVPAQPPAAASLGRSRNGLGVAALVVGVASLVAALSFVLFPRGFLGGLVAVILGIIAISRGRARIAGAANRSEVL